jgi:cation-transporting ATPase F
MECLQAGILCNDSDIRKTEKGWKVEGDPTEGALICAAEKAGLDRDTLEKALSRVDSVPFESQYQYMATLHSSTKQKSCIVYIKGSVESILSRCSSRMDTSGKTSTIEPKAVQSQGEQLATQGLRVLAFARTERPPGTKTIDHPDVESGLTFLGLQGMIDPPRQEAIDAVEACHEAGIQVKMITGDHALTAVAIASQIGLTNEDNPHVITGKALTEMSDQDLAEQIEKTAVFARVSPDQKLRLVKALQSKGHVVAMTGDGVNDAPALRQADIGVAMGKAGTEVAREAGDMILTDDDFASIEAAVEEGRGVFDNLTKFIVWTLPTNLGEGLVILAAIFAGVSLPILPVQILWINMSTAILLGMMLAFEPKEPGIMKRPPRDPHMPILTRQLGLRIVLVGTIMLIGCFGLFNYERWQGADEAVARTVAVNVFVMVELFYLFNCRSLRGHWLGQGLLSNPWLYIGVTSMIGLQMLFTYVPFMNHLFTSAPIGLISWLRILAIALGAHIIVTLEKMFWWRQSTTYKIDQVNSRKSIQ